MEVSRVSDYIESKRRAWSPVTMRNTAVMLSRYEKQILEGTPELFYEHLEQHGVRVSSIGTLFTLAAGFFKWVNGTEPFTEWRRNNANSFKNKETKKIVGKSWEEIKAKIEAEKDCWQKEAAKEIIGTAKRSCEVGLGRYGFERVCRGSDRELIGKGGKSRVDLGEVATEYPTGTYHQFYSWCKNTLEVTPHQLRKLALTRAAENGASAADLCAIAGWSSISTAYYYLQPKDSERLANLLR